MELLAGVIIGAVVVWMAPGLVGGLFRPAAKGAIKGGTVAYKAMKEAVVEASESVRDMVSEAQSELGHGSENGVGERKKRREKV